MLVMNSFPYRELGIIHASLDHGINVKTTGADRPDKCGQNNNFYFYNKILRGNLHRYIFPPIKLLFAIYERLE